MCFHNWKYLNKDYRACEKCGEMEYYGWKMGDSSPATMKDKWWRWTGSAEGFLAEAKAHEKRISEEVVESEREAQKLRGEQEKIKEMI